MPLSAFPYSEGFEAGPAWTIKSDSLNSDWAWGTPTHPAINAAGGGAKCWTIGGLTGSFYKYKQIASLESPCFDFSALSYPWISFKIYWEDEWKYDGLSLQSSTDGGITWKNVGAFGDPVDCLNDNWFNNGNVTWLDSAKWKTMFNLNKGIHVPQGWSGRTGATSGTCQGGNGSNGWVTSKHCLAGLANNPSVRFRFIFGAGTTCNSYDGIAIDDIFIDNAPPEVPNFTSVCAGLNSINFTNLSAPCTTTTSWNFGDGASASNTSAALNPGHTFSGPGTYTVTLTTTGSCNAPGTIAIPVSILGVNMTAVPVTCNGLNNGSATATGTGGSGPYNYTWNPGGQTTATITPLAPGTYSVLVTSAGACSIKSTVVVTQPALLTATGNSTAASCGNNSGTGTVTAAGGTTAYTYSWNPGGASTAAITGLAPGNDTCFVTDASGCHASAFIVITASSSLTSTATPTSATCNMSNGAVFTTLAGGTGAITYSWSPSGGTASAATNLGPGLYTCTITDAGGCSKKDTATVFNVGTPPNGTLTPAGTPAICQGTSLVLKVSGGGTYSWNNGSVADSLVVNSAGTYQVVVTNACGKDTLTKTISIKPLPLAVITGGPGVCAGDSVLLTAAGGTQYVWSNNDTSHTIYVSAAGTYTVAVSNTCGVSTASTVVNVNTVLAQFTADSTVGYAPFTVLFTNSSSANASSWNWNFGDGLTGTGPNPNHTYGVAGTYTAVLTVTDPQGCKGTYSITIIVHDLPSWVVVPNVFTPNGDGTNESFAIQSQGLHSFDMKIYDRWGVLMVDLTDPGQGWDGRTKSGTLVSAGTFYYIMDAKGIDGKTYAKNGCLMMIR